GASNPKLQQQIEDEFDAQQINPKLPKTYTSDPGGSRKAQLVAMRSSNVRDWSTIAARLRALPPENRRQLAAKLLPDSILPQEELTGLDPEKAMWKEVFTGIKVGTDAFKTSVPAGDFERRASWYSAMINQHNLYALPFGKALMKTIDLSGPPDLGTGAWRDVFFGASNQVQTKMGAPVRGISARVLENMIYNLIPPWQRQSIPKYRALWLKQMRGVG
ncbi:MAG: hypothetical protein MI919_13310, partial [Holophagales bacterium]|nr:hypothetical protein [Holophagales bacterium]